VYAYREDAPRHADYRTWLEDAVDQQAPFAVADIVLSGFIRVVTHPGIFSPPAPVERAIGFVEALRSQPNRVTIAPGQRHWDIFTSLCREAGARGNLVADAYLAALAIESGSEWITADRGYARFPGLRWRHPLQP